MIFKKVALSFFSLGCFIACSFCQSEGLSAQKDDRGTIKKGITAYKKGDMKEAEMHFEQAKSINPSNQNLYNHGNSLYRNQKFEEAAQSYGQMKLGNDQNSIDGLFNQGNAYFQAQKYDEAMNSYKSALKLDPHDKDALSNYLKTKKIKKSQQQQQKQQNKESSQSKEDQPQEQQKNSNDIDKQKDTESKTQEKNGQDQKQPTGADSDKKLNPQMAEKILDQINEMDKKVQQKLNKDGKPDTNRRGKDW